MRLLDGHRPDGDGDVRPLRAMEFEKGPIVHLVDVVAGQHQDRLRRSVGDEVDVLQDRVRGTPVPLAGPPPPEVGLEQAHPTA